MNKGQSSLLVHFATAQKLALVISAAPCHLSCPLSAQLPVFSQLSQQASIGRLVHLQAQMLSVQLLAIPTLLETIGHSTPLAADRNPLLVSGQDELCQVFISWLEDTNVSAYGSARLTQGHGPALLAFAATAALSRDVPSLSGQR